MRRLTKIFKPKSPVNSFVPSRLYWLDFQSVTTSFIHQEEESPVLSDFESVNPRNFSSPVNNIVKRLSKRKSNIGLDFKEKNAKYWNQNRYCQCLFLVEISVFKNFGVSQYLYLFMSFVLGVWSLWRLLVGEKWLQNDCRSRLVLLINGDDVSVGWW